MISRDRTKGTVEVRTGYERSSSGSVYGPVNLGKVTNTAQERMVDQTGPEWRRAVKEGKVLIRPYSRTRLTVSSFGTGYAGQRNSDGVTYTFDGEHHLSLVPQDAFGFPVEASSPLNSLEVDNLIRLSATDAWAGVTDGKANFLESLAEAQSTIDMIRSIANGTWKSWKGISNLGAVPGAWGQAAKSFYGKWKASPGNMAKKGLGSVSNGWLMWRYGLNPLMQDIQAVMTSTTAVRTERRKSRSNQTLSRSSSTRREWTAGVYYGEIVCDVEEVVTVKTTIIYDERRGIMADLGITTRNFTSLPWQLMSLSFVYDWFVNVGDFIDAIAPKGGVDILGSWTTVVRRKTTTYTVTGTGISSGWTLLKGDQGTVQRVDESVVRTTPAASPGLAMQWTDKDWSLNRKIDSLALLYGRFSSLWQPARKGSRKT